MAGAGDSLVKQYPPTTHHLRGARKLKVDGEGEGCQLLVLQGWGQFGLERVFFQGFCRVAPALAKVIDRLIVDNSKQPSLKVGDLCRRQQVVGFGQRVLDHILRIDDGAGHPRTVSVKVGPDALRQLIEFFKGLRQNRWVGRLGDQFSFSIPVPVMAKPMPSLYGSSNKNETTPLPTAFGVSGVPKRSRNFSLVIPCRVA